MEERQAGCDTQKLERLQSLLFASEKAEKDNPSQALEISKRLIGFLEAQTTTLEDAAYLPGLKQQGHVRVQKIKQSLPILDKRTILENAGVSEDFRFKGLGALDLSSLKDSEPFGTILKNADSLHHKKEFVPGHRDGPSSIRSKKVSAPHPAVSNQQQPQAPLKLGKPSFRQAKLPALYTPSTNRPSSYIVLKEAADSKPDNTVNAVAAQPALSYAGLSKQKNQSLWVRGLSKIVDADEEDEMEIDLTARQKRAKHGDTNTIETHQRRQNKRRLSDDDDEIEESSPSDFMSAKQKLTIEDAKKGLQSSFNRAPQQGFKPPALKRGVRGAFVPPIKNSGGTILRKSDKGSEQGVEESETTRKLLESLAGPDGELPDRIKNIEAKLLEHISNEIIDKAPKVTWDDIAGLGHAKKSIQELVVWPLKRPDLFSGVRSPGKGLLLFGPPGTGKTLLGKAIAAEANATFFSISASSLTSKWIGEGEKLVRALFGVASCRQPAVIFIDEVDSLLSQRKSEGEHESSRRLKTQFLIEMEGCCSGDERLLLIGATNRPQELDEAARRRLSKRLYIPLPTADARAAIVENLLGKDGLMSLSESEMQVIRQKTKGYSGSDVKNLVKEASLGPLREAMMRSSIDAITTDQMRPITLQDFENALHQVRASVSPNELLAYQDWNKQFGSLAVGEGETDS